jgi:hypothetical protein
LYFVINSSFVLILHCPFSFVGPYILSSSNIGTKYTSDTDKVQTSKHVPHISHLLRENVALSEIVSFFNSMFYVSCIRVILPVMPTSLFVTTCVCYDPDKGICAHRLSSTAPAISSNLAPIFMAGSVQWRA